MLIAVTDIPLGTLVSADFLLFRHRGVVTGHDPRRVPLVTSNSMRRGRVVQERWEEFSQGRPVQIEAEQPSSPMVVVGNALSGVGMRYDLLRFNCDHFVEWASGQKPTSAQVVKWGVALVAIGVSVWATKNR